MELFKIVLTSILSVLVLFILAKLIGNRQLSQLSMFEYINGITIGSIAAELATSLEDDFLKPLIAMVVYALLTMLFSFVATKSIKMRRILNGKSAVLYNDGKIFADNLKKSKLDINEFLTQCRIAGYYDLNSINSAVMEQNGKISFLPNEKYRPVTPDDMGLLPKKATLQFNVIIDGKIMRENLNTLGFDEIWLNKQLELKAIRDMSLIFLCTCDVNGDLSIFMKDNDSIKGDIFM